MAYGPGRMDKIRLRGLTAPTGYVFPRRSRLQPFFATQDTALYARHTNRLITTWVISFDLSNRLDSVTLQLANYLWLTQLSHA